MTTAALLTLWCATRGVMPGLAANCIARPFLGEIPSRQTRQQKKRGCSIQCDVQDPRAPGRNKSFQIFFKRPDRCRFPTHIQETKNAATLLVPGSVGRSESMQADSHKVNVTENASPHRTFTKA